MNGANNLPDLADWMLYGGGAVAVLGLILSAVRNRTEVGAGMAQPIAILGIVVFLVGLVMVVQQGTLDIGAMP